MRETQKEGEGEAETESKERDKKKTGRVGDRKIAGRGSMKPPNLTLRGKDIKLDHRVTTNQGTKQLVRRQNDSSLSLRLQRLYCLDSESTELKRWSRSQKTACFSSFSLTEMMVQRSHTDVPITYP